MCELLSPCGNIECLNAAVANGCDAVYLGVKSFNARLRTTNFAFNQLEAAVEALHNRGKKIYITVNTVVTESETERLFRLLHHLRRIKVDALIVQDFATIRMAQEFFGDLPLHASTQMNISSAAAVGLLESYGVERAVLSRELSLNEIKSIKEKTRMELEVFVHGALCISESGLCQFSSYLGGKSANRGQCAQACRRLYTAQFPEGDRTGYYFSPGDLSLIERVPDLIEAGVSSFKIEGRMKSAEYVGLVTKAFRYVIDNYKADKKGAIETGKRILSQDFARDKTTYFFDCKDPLNESERVEKSSLNAEQPGGTGIYLGRVTQIKKITYDTDEKDEKVNTNKDASNNKKNKDTDKVSDDKKDKAFMAALSGDNYEVDVGDTVRIHKKDDSGRISCKVRVTKRFGEKLFFNVPDEVKTGDSVYLLQIKSAGARNPNILPHDLKKYKEQPRDEALPILDLTKVLDKDEKPFPAGLYVKVSSLNDAYLCQGLNPVRVLLEYNSEFRRTLNKGVTLPFSKKQIFIALDPFCTPTNEEELKKDLNNLISLGYSNFVVNNLSHLKFLEGKKVFIIAGEYLYTFNRWAASFLENCGAEAFTSPAENSKKNLLATFERDLRNRVLLPVFSYPVLFRIRLRLGEDYSFTYFSDKAGEQFRLARTPDGSFVMSELPFSLLDKLHDLEKDGFNRFLIDFSKTQITKNQIKNLIASMQKGLPLPESNRFNFQRGFFIQRDKEKSDK